MYIDLSKKSADITYEEIKYLSKYIGKVFSIYFKLKKCKSDYDTAYYGNYVFYYKYHPNGFSYYCNDIEKHKDIALMRYYNYPEVDDNFYVNTWAPNQGWMLGFVEKLILALDRNLLHILEKKDSTYDELLKDSDMKFKEIQQNPVKPNEWNSYISEIEKKNLSMNISPVFLSYERNSTKELTEDIKKLLQMN